MVSCTCPCDDTPTHRTLSITTATASVLQRLRLQPLALAIIFCGADERCSAACVFLRAPRTPDAAGHPPVRVRTPRRGASLMSTARCLPVRASRSLELHT
jgi:hypothetical protein